MTPIIGAHAPPPDPLGLRRVDRTALAAVIAEEIRQQGPISFHRFMELALYHPELGYYSRFAPGPDADYVTSSELHWAFGALLSAQFEQMWRLLDRPDPFWLIEAGPGTGRFARDVLETARFAFPEFASALHVALMERAASLRHAQKQLLTSWHERVRWLDADPSAWESMGDGCIVANEIVDAFPVHRVVMRKDGLQEVWVDIGHDRFVELERPASSDLTDQFAVDGGRLPVDCFAEVNRKTGAWLQAVVGLIERGYLLFIDYGADAERLYSGAHPRGTLRGYQGHALVEDPIALPGWRDLTADVDLSGLRRDAEACGMTPAGRSYQTDFLGRLGIKRLLRRAAGAIADRSQQRAEIAALDALIDPNGLGRLEVMAFAKNAPNQGLTGFPSPSL